MKERKKERKKEMKKRVFPERRLRPFSACGLVVAVILGIVCVCEAVTPQEFADIRQKADQGDAEAQNAMGECYYSGDGMEKNLETAVQWYRRAAEQNYAEAQFNLGVCYAEGEGVEKNLTEAVRLYRLAAEQNNAKAQCGLGICYAQGDGVEESPVEAVMWFRKAAEQNLAVAQFYLGICYEKGMGVKTSPEEANNWYRKAAEQGHEEAREKLETLKKQAVAETKKAAEQQRKIEEQRKQFLADMPLLANAIDQQTDQADPIVKKWQMNDFPEFRDLYDKLNFYADLYRRKEEALQRLHDEFWTHGKSYFRIRCGTCGETGKQFCRTCGGTGKCPVCRGSGKKKAYENYMEEKQMGSIAYEVECNPICPKCKGDPPPCLACGGRKGTVNIRKVRLAWLGIRKRIASLLARPTLYQEYIDGSLTNAINQANYGSYRDRIDILDKAIQRLPNAQNIAQAQTKLEHCRKEHSLKETRVQEAMRRSSQFNNYHEAIKILDSVINDFPDAENISSAHQLKSKYQMELARREKEKQQTIARIQAREAAAFSGSGSSGRRCADCGGRGYIERYYAGNWYQLRCQGCSGSGQAGFATDYIDSSGNRQRSTMDQMLRKAMMGF